jgi:acetyl esterase/lipase
MVWLFSVLIFLSFSSPTSLVADSTRHSTISFSTIHSSGIDSSVGEGDPETIVLWPPGTLPSAGRTEEDVSTLTMYLPPQADIRVPALVICPGGGYASLAMEHEGHAVARWLNGLNVAGMVLKYRLPGNGHRHPAPLQDVQRALSLVRSRADWWQIDPTKIGVIGFSAGGHLASTVGTHFHHGLRRSQDPVERYSCRPDFMILIYPVITMKSFTHQRSRELLLGAHFDIDLVHQLSNELQVTSQTPPTFLLHAADDRVVSFENSLLFFTALREVGVPAELHIYDRGGHGFGLGKESSIVGSSWQDRCADWLRSRGIIGEDQ